MNELDTQQAFTDAQDSLDMTDFDILVQTGTEHDLVMSMDFTAREIGIYVTPKDAESAHWLISKAKQAMSDGIIREDGKVQGMYDHYEWHECADGKGIVMSAERPMEFVSQ